MDYISRRQSSVYVHKPRDYSPYEFLTTLAVVWEKRKTQLEIVLERRVIDLKRPRMSSLRSTLRDDDEYDSEGFLD
ncbi:hypothetical protein PNOK_0788100 [Pyrrhoderma noxium]|uniref:Uncharacterized protein n=1 Tax=Pyrrhoderma noxium TaxID=2282107 RepID=A0A286U9J3_9AGAM|nr:hypothetical protein PNOK_0788100 [Pyrrhoderma noxium]